MLPVDQEASASGPDPAADAGQRAWPAPGDVAARSVAELAVLDVLVSPAVSVVWSALSAGSVFGRRQHVELRFALLVGKKGCV